MSNRVFIGIFLQFMVTCATPLMAYGLSIYWTGSILQLENVTMINQSTVAEEGNSNDLYAIFESLSNASLEDQEAIKRRIVVSTVVGGFFAFVTGLFISHIFFPSVVATTLKLRRGVIPTLENQRDLVLVYRKSLDYVTYLIGGMFWGVFISCAAVVAISGVIIYLLLDPNLQFFSLKRIGNYLGTVWNAPSSFEACLMAFSSYATRSDSSYLYFMRSCRFGPDSGLLPGRDLPLRELYPCRLLPSSSLHEQHPYDCAGVLLNCHIRLVHDCARINANLYVCTISGKD